jgi:hypothetical protein
MYESVGEEVFVTASAKQYEDVDGLRRQDAVYSGL